MWFLYAIGFVVLTTTLAMFFKKLSGETKNQRAFNFLFNLFSLLATLALLLVAGVKLQTVSLFIFALAAVSGILHGLFHRYHFVVRKNMEASIIETVMAPAAIVGYALAIFWLQESITFAKIFGYSLILLAGMAAVWQRNQKFKLNRYVLLALFVSVCANVAVIIDRRVSIDVNSALLFAAFLWFMQALVCYIPYIPKTDVVRELKTYKWLLPALASINALVLVLAISALQQAPATRVLPVLNSNVVFIALTAVIVFKERQRVGVKVAAAFVACVGLFLVSR